MEKDNKQKDRNKVDSLDDWIKDHKLCVGSFIIFLGFFIGSLIAFWLHSLTGLGIMGTCILFSVLIGANFLSKEKDLTTGEVRRAITISFISVFFGLLAFGDTIKTDNRIINSILENFWWIIVTIIGFYFGGRSAENIVENITKRWSKNSSGNSVEKLEKK
ncbi:hypothetical protein ACO3UB_01640 [Methanocaldococcus sp. 16A]